VTNLPPLSAAYPQALTNLPPGLLFTNLGLIVTTNGLVLTNLASGLSLTLGTNGNLTANTLTVQSNGSLTIHPPLGSGFPDTVIAAPSITSGGATINGPLSANSLNVNISSALGAASGSTLTMSGAGSFGGSVSSAGLTDSGGITETGGDISVATGYKLDGSGAGITNLPPVGGLQGGAMTNAQFGLTVGDGINVISTGSKGYARIPINLTVNGWALAGNVTNSSIAVDIYRTNSTSFPPTQSIWSGAPPTLTLTNVAGASGLSIQLSAGDWIAYQITAATNCSRVYLAIYGVPR